MTLPRRGRAPLTGMFVELLRASICLMLRVASLLTVICRVMVLSLLKVTRTAILSFVVRVRLMSSFTSGWLSLLLCR